MHPGQQKVGRILNPAFFSVRHNQNLGKLDHFVEEGEQDELKPLEHGAILIGHLF